MDNIISVSVKRGQKVMTRSIYQYDQGMILELLDADPPLPQTFQVHFSNDPEDQNTKPQIGQNNRVTVPYDVTKTGLPVHAWVYLHTGQDDGETVYHTETPVIGRSPTEGETPTPEEQSEISQAIIALNEGVEQATEAAATAQAAADTVTNSNFYIEEGHLFWETSGGEDIGEEDN